MPKFGYLMIGVAVITLSGFLLWSNYGHDYERPDYRHSSLAIIRGDGRVISYAVEVALTPEEQAYGLMFVKSLPPHEGMIFPYSPPQNVSFWMKNTLIPLDMLFVGPDGTISHIVTNARPEDLTPIPSLGPVIGVIEIRGGMVKIDGIQEGDRIQSPLLIVTPR